MRELKDMLIYLASVACFVLGIWASASWALNQYHSLLPSEGEGHTMAAASEPDLAGEASTANDPFRQPVWIEPTKKYVYNPLQVMAVRPDPAIPAAVPKTSGHSAAKPARRRHVVSSEARRAYGSEAQPQPQQLLILPLQHQAPH